MNKAARHVLRRLGTDTSLDHERQQRLSREVQEEQQKRREQGGDQDTGFETIPEEMLTESEKAPREVSPPTGHGWAVHPRCRAPAHYDS